MVSRRLLIVMFSALLIFVCLCIMTGVGRNSSVADAEGKPIAPAGSKIGELLRQWYADGTAAGNTGDYYDNRDRGHSMLNLAQYPQLRKIEYTEAESRSRQDWGLQKKVLPHIVFGNSSTSFAPTAGGSNPRNYYVTNQGVEFLFNAYIRNNLYIYPEHADYDPGHNGIGGEGFGDLYPANTPYLIISQGSSGSDQPFMQAIPRTLAAFRPEVKQKLQQVGMLMPAIQMILRITGRQISSVDDYLTGKAHPPVFQGDQIDPLKMVNLAHDMTLSDLPPLCQIHVINENENPVAGRDYFDPNKTEKLADTPAAIARVFRGAAQTRTITVSAETSKDLNKKPIKFFWSVLQGDAGRIKIEYLNPEHSAAKITVHYFDRFPLQNRPDMESNRVDIGVFAHNGTYYSPPAFITFFTLDSESRTYADDGKILDVGYGMGTTRMSVSDWAGLLKMLAGDGKNWREKFLRGRFSAAELSGLRKLAAEFQKADAIAVAARDRYNQAVAAQKGDSEIEADRKAMDAARKAGEEILKKKLPGQTYGAAPLIQKTLNKLLEDMDLWPRNAAALQSLLLSASAQEIESFTITREALASFGVIRNSDNGSFALNPVQKGNAPLAKRLTRFEKAQIARLNAALLAHVVFPRMLRDEWHVNYVDSRLDTLKEWRDVYRYAPDGTPLGWTRYQKDGVQKFNAEGLLILEEDDQGRCVKARSVRYEITRKNQQSADGIRSAPTQNIREYRYSDASDWKGATK